MNNPTVSPLMQTRQVQALEWFVLVETGSLAGHRFPLTSIAGSLTLGREADCTIRFDPKQERMVGRHHARIEVRGDGVYLVDTHSANGTFQNGEAVSEVRLQHGDRFQLGGEMDDIQGPWISIHLPVAVHQLPVTPDSATLVIRPGEMGALRAAVHLAPTIAPLAAVSAPPPRPPAITPALPSPYSQPSGTAEFAPVSPRDLPAGSLPVDPLHRQRRAYLVRQVAVIILLLVLACGVGMALGLRDTSEPATESAARGG